MLSNDISLILDRSRVWPCAVDGVATLSEVWRPRLWSPEDCYKSIVRTGEVLMTVWTAIGQLRCGLAAGLLFDQLLESPFELQHRGSTLNLRLSNSFWRIIARLRNHAIWNMPCSSWWIGHHVTEMAFRTGVFVLQPTSLDALHAHSEDSSLPGVMSSRVSWWIYACLLVQLYVQ